MRISDWSSDVCSSDLLIARFDINLAGSLVDEIIGAVTAKYFLGRDQQVAEPVLGGLVRGTRRNLLPGRENHLTRISVDDVEGRLLSTPRFGAERNLPTAFTANAGQGVIDGVENFLAVKAQSMEKRGPRKLALPVND